MRVAKNWALAPLIVAGCLSGQAQAWEMSGEKAVYLHDRDGGSQQIGKVTFTPSGEQTAFKVDLDLSKFTDYFLSMREFKCVAGGGEVYCRVPYPYPQPGLVSQNDLAWLEHSLLFLYNVPGDYGAKLGNGLYFKLQETPTGLEGVPQAIDLSVISAQPDEDAPPFNEHERVDIDGDARWVTRLTIE